MSTKAAAQTQAAKPVGDELKDAIKRQVEFYFSRANLANDAFLVSQMNSQMYVPIETIIGFGKIKQLTDSAELLVESILDSKVVVLNETKDAIKPNAKSERNTIILREIPSATKPEDVQAIFDGCGDVVSVRSDVGDTWFVTLPSEDAAVSTLLALRSKTFNDAPIKARLKSENVLKSFYTAQTTEPVAAANAAGGAYARGYYATASAGYYDMPNNYGVQYASGPRAQYNNNGSAPRQGGRGAGGQQRGSVNTQPKEGRAKSNSFDQQNQQPRPASRKAKDKKAKAAAAAAASSAAPAGKKAASAAAAPAAERQPVLNSANFPPLPVPEKAVEEIKFQYAHEDILEIVKHMDESDCKLAEGKLDYEAHAVALTPIAHPDLLRNQRTYSIEQAREALRQGRPIRSDSIGSIDYESMMYGEDYTKEARELRKQKAEAGESKPAAATVAPPAASAAAPAVAAAAAAPKVLGYAAAVILGTPAPQPPIEAKKKVAPATTATAAAPAKGKGAKPAKDEAKKGGKKSGKAGENKTAVVVDDVPKAGAWGGRAFLEVVKSEPVNPPPAPVVKAAPVAAASAAAAPANGRKTSGEWVKDKTFKDRRQMDKQ